MLRTLLIITAGVATAACASLVAPTPSGAPDPNIERGQRFAQRACAGCHAIGVRGQSPSGNAPAFGTLRLRYTSPQLVRRLAVISRDGHYEMPPIYISPDEANDLAYYVESLGDARP